MTIKRLLLWAVIAFAAWMIFTDPLQAAGIVHSGENLTGRGAHSTSTFVSHALPGNP